MKVPAFLLPGEIGRDLGSFTQVFAPMLDQLLLEQGKTDSERRTETACVHSWGNSSEQEGTKGHKQTGIVEVLGAKAGTAHDPCTWPHHGGGQTT